MVQTFRVLIILGSWNRLERSLTHDAYLLPHPHSQQSLREMQRESRVRRC